MGSCISIYKKGFQRKQTVLYILPYHTAGQVLRDGDTSEVELNTRYPRSDKVFFQLDTCEYVTKCHIRPLERYGKIERPSDPPPISKYAQ